MFPWWKFARILGQPEIAPSARTEAVLITGVALENRVSHLCLIIPEEALTAVANVYLTLFPAEADEVHEHVNCSFVSCKSVSVAARPTGKIVKIRHRFTPISIKKSLKSIKSLKLCWFTQVTTSQMISFSSANIQMAFSAFSKLLGLRRSSYALPRNHLG